MFGAGETTDLTHAVGRPTIRPVRLSQKGGYSKSMIDRTLLLAFLGVALTSAIPLAAEVEVTPFLGYQFGGGFETREGDLNIDPNANLGLVVSLRTRHDGLVEVLYSRQATSMELQGILDTGDLFDLTVEYLQVGGLWEIKTDQKRPFLGLTVGGTRLGPGSSGVDDEWAFSAGISGGLKYFFTERLALRVEGRGLLSFFNSSGVIFCGFPPGQCGIGVTGSNFVQFNFLAGLTVRF